MPGYLGTTIGKLHWELVIHVYLKYNGVCIVYKQLDGHNLLSKQNYSYVQRLFNYVWFIIR